MAHCSFALPTGAAQVFTFPGNCHNAVGTTRRFTRPKKKGTSKSTLLVSTYKRLAHLYTLVSKDTSSHGFCIVLFYRYTVVPLRGDSLITAKLFLLSAPLLPNIFPQIDDGVVKVSSGENGIW